MKLNILNNVSNSLGRTGLRISKASPEIFVGIGIGCMIAGTVFACKATLKADTVIKEKNETLGKVKAAREAVLNDDEDFKDITEDVYSVEDYRKDLLITYSNAAKGFIKLYWPAILCGTVGIASILYGHNILSSRNVAIAAAYETVKEGYSEYRKRVVDELGEDADRRFRYGIQKKDIEIEEEKEDGTVKTKTKKNADVLEGYSQNAKFFDSSSPYWEKSSEHNLYFLRERQEYANHLLQTRGHLFLNEVFDMLGIPRTKQGAVDLWRYKCKDGTTGFVDFGIYELYREAARDFVNGYENVILLDFNTNGTIYDDDLEGLN